MEFISDTTDRLDKFLVQHIKDVSRGRIQKAIKDGLVLINGKIILAPHRFLKINDRIELPEFGTEELQASNYQLQVVFENDDLAVIDKPPGLVVHPAAGHKQDTLVNALLSRFPGIEKIGDPVRPGIVHRLDEDTSGLIVVAKTQKAFEYLKDLFKNRELDKHYLTLVHGRMPALHGRIDKPIEKTSTHQKMKVVEDGRPALTEYTVIAESDLRGTELVSVSKKLDPQPSSEGPRVLDSGSLQYTLLLVKLHTGRTHQIRVHLSSIGNPVVGDELYGGQYKQRDKDIISRQFLHAHRLKFKLMDKTVLELESPLPKDLKQVLKKLTINIPVA
jgi:23S rRNA pseudouridine1911/1915/1917 synthase